MTMTSTIAAASADTFVFFDSRVAGWQTLAEALPPGSAWYLLDGASDGLAQIAAVLAGRSDVQAVHIVSHGAEGSLQLGSSTLTADTLHAHAGELAAIGATLAENGDILLYGCEAGAGSAGAALVDAFAALSGADVAASTDVTGAAALGGNWLLERSNGQVDAMTLGSDGSLAGFAGTLATSTRFDFSSDIVNADDTPDGAGRGWMSQTIGGNTLTLTADTGLVSVVNEDVMTGGPDPVMDGAIFTVDYNASSAPNKITLSLDGGKLFDLTRLSILDLTAGMSTLVITTNRGPVEISLNGGFTGQVLTMPDHAFLKGVSRAVFSDKNGNPLVVEFDDIVLSNIASPNQAPTFVAGPATINVAQNGVAIDLKSLLHASDTDVGNTLTWSVVSGPANGTANFSSATAAAGGTDITPGGTLTYTPNAGFAGTNTITVQVSDSIASATKTITVNVTPQQPASLDLSAASDTGLRNDDNVTAANALVISGTSAAGDNSSLVRVFIDTNGNGAYDAGEAYNTSTVNNGSWSVGGISTVGLNGNYNVYAQVTSATGGLASAPSTALQVQIDHAGPTILFNNIQLSQDSGSSNTDLQTNVAAQTITSTLSQALAAGDVVMGSLDNGATWTNITAMVSGTTLTWTGATLVANGGIRLRTLDEHGNIGSTTPKPYVLDQAPPATTISSALFSMDSGNDFILNAASQSLSGTLSANLAAGEIVEVSLNNGASWTTASATPGSSAWSLAGITLTGSDTLRVRVTDAAGNHGAQLTKAYVLDQAAPTASMPASTQLVAPSGASFTVTVTYADTGGAGIDTSTFGTGNIRVTGPLGMLAVSGYSASGSTVTYTVSAPGGSWDPADAGQYTVAIQPNSVRDQAGNAVAANASAGTIDVVYSTAAAVGALRLSADTGTSDTDFITNAATQTIQATLSRALGVGETVWGSLDNGGSWTDITAKTSGTAVAWDGVTLAAGGTIVIRALDGNGLTGTPASHAYKLDTGVPVQTVLTAALAADSGTPGDFITKVENQSIAGTLSAPLAADEFVQVSFDNGATWMAASTSGTDWSLNGFTLPSAGTLQVRVSDIAGNGGTPWAHAYRLDTSAPTANVLSAALASDSGVNGDFITNVASQSLAGTLSAPLGAGEFVEVSFDNGASWTAASTSGSTWTLNGVMLAGAGTLQVRVSDIADNHGTAWSHSYRLDTTAPTAGNPVRADMRDPSGASFSFTLTYADSGAGIDPATIGSGNVSVTGPAGALSVLGASASGNTVTYTVAAPGGGWDAGDTGLYTIGINAGIADLAGNALAANADAGAFEVTFSAPTVSALTLSLDTGASNSDFITNAAVQTIGATLSRPLVAGEVLQGSLDNGATWTVITGKASGTAVAWDGVTLAAGGTIVLRVLDVDGAPGTAASHAYTLDADAPAQSVTSAALAVDSGLAGDFVTNVAAQTLSGTLSAPLGAGDFVEVSFDNGASWTTAAAIGGNWSLGGVTLAGAGTLQVRVSDIAGNQGEAWAQNYRLDTTAPMAGTPVRANLVDPSGTSFTFTVTYADSGAGIDPATIGAGNVSVTGPGGTLSILGASASGNTVTYTVAAPGGSWDLLDSGSYTIGINAQVKDLAGNTVAANAAAGGFGVSFAAPAVGALGLSLDSGSSATDFITNSAAQTVGATLSRTLVAGETVQGSLDNGATWTDITAKISGTTLAWDGVTLPASGTLVVRVLGTDGAAGTAASQAYVLDTQAPLQRVATAALSADSGVDGDFITNAASQALAGTLSAALGAGEFVEVSLDNGGSWTTAAASGNAWNLAGFTLPASGTLQVRVSDIAGNHGAAWTQAYRVDTDAPTAAAPVRADMVDPSGASFTFTVTYTDSGVGIDPATIGAGNVSVTGAGGALAVLGASASGNTVTYTVEAPGGGWDPADSGSYTIGINAQVKDLAGNAVAANAAAGSFAVRFAAPAVGALGLSLDSGSSNTDFITNSAAQTVGATLSRALIAGEIAQGSLDNGATWTDITAKVSGTTLAWDGVTLPASGTLVVRVLGTNGAAGTPASHAYTLDTATPAQSIASAALAVDSAVAGDFITNVAAQTLSGTLSAPLGAGDFVEVSLDNGASWTAAAGSGSTWSLGGIALPAFGTLQVRVSDIAGNQGTAWTQAYQVDTAAPTVGTPVRANLVDPSGTSFSFTVTYADGGAGIDPATIGAGNVSVTGPGGALNVLGVAVSGNTVTYTVEAPGGSWDPLDAGSYTIGINAQVKDLAGNTVAANAAAHSFTVGVNSAPTLGGVFATPAIADDATASPFAGVTVADLDGDALTLTIAYTAANGTLSGTGLSGSAGNYTLSGSAAEVQAALRGLVFTPTANQSAGAPVATSFTLSASDGSASTSNSATVVSAAPVAPTATVGLSDTDLRAGESATLTLNFSEAVTGLDAGDLTLTGLSLGALESSNGGRTWTATVTPAAGIASASHQVLLDLAGVLDAGGLAGSGVVTGPGYTIRTLRPTATLSVDDTSLTAGETTTLSITFSEAVTGFSLADLTVDRGTVANLASSDGGITWTATLTPAPGVAAATNTVRLDLTGVQNAAGNAGSGVATSNTYAVATAPDEPAPPAGGTIDGVPVATSSYTDPATGLVNQAIGVPVVGAGRTDDPNSPNAPLADIPLTAVGGGASSTLTVSLPVGAGLQANGPASLLGKGEALLDLIRRIEQKTVQGTDTREQMTGEGSGFLDALASGTMLHTATVAPVSTATTDSILVTGGAAGGTAVGIVIDATGLHAGTTLRLDNVDFAAVVGGATLRGGMGNNIVVGDGASQNIFLGEGDDQLFGGGGDDVIGSAGGDDLLDGGSGKDFLAGGIGNDRLVGGSGDDVLQGGRSSSGAWQFTLGANGSLGAVHQTAVFAPGAQETLALAELDRGSAELAFLSASRATLTDMALLYQAAFERAPDIAGLNFYLAKGVDAAAVARSVVASAEWSGDGTGALSDAAFVQRLYSTVFEREGDSAGVAFWTGKLAGGALSRADALLAFALADEHRALHADGLVVAAADVQRENGWILGSGDDRLEGGAGSDLLVGGDGTDTVVYAGKLADYRFVLGADGTVKVADKANADVDTLFGIELGEFSDGTVDLGFTQAGAATLEAVGLLYQTLLDRAGDLGGLSWWAGSGLDGAQLVTGFTASSEFTARYGAMSDAAFVAALYANSGLDASAAGGSAAWVNMLQHHSRAELIGSWIAQQDVLDAHLGSQGLWLL